MNIIFHKNNIDKTNLSNNKNKNHTKTKEQGYKFVMGEKHFFHGSHDSLTIISNDVFLIFYSKLTNNQRIELSCFFEALSKDEIINVSEIKKTNKDRLTYVTIKFKYRDKIYTKNMFYFFGLNKLLSFRGKAKINLTLKGLLKQAKEQ